jgi:CMP-N-acetylneuraminic acid synthetase
MHVTAIIPAKGNSRRLPGKNLQPFGDSTLVSHKVSQLSSCAGIDDVVVATNCEMVANEAERHGASIRMQDDLHCDEDKMPLRERWRNIVARVETDVVVWAHCTNPLCPPEVYDAAVDAFEADGGHDSLCSVTKVQRHAWQKLVNPVDGGKWLRHVNFNPWGDRHQFASELDPYYFQNGAIFIQPHRQMLENGYFYGKRPLLFEIEQPYDLDVDTERDLWMAQAIHAAMKQEAATC